jgi:hypothetical protein
LGGIVFVCVFGGEEREEEESSCALLFFERSFSDALAYRALSMVEGGREVWWCCSSGGV